MDVFCIKSVDIDSVECIRDPCPVSTVSTYIVLIVLCYQHHSYLITVLLFQHLFQTQYLMFYSTYHRATPLLTTTWPLSPKSSNLQSVFSFHRDKLCVYVWINIVDIKPNLCLYTSSTTNSTVPSKIHQMVWLKSPQSQLSKTFCRLNALEILIPYVNSVNIYSIWGHCIQSRVFTPHYSVYSVV